MLTLQFYIAIHEVIRTIGVYILNRVKFINLHPKTKLKIQKKPYSRIMMNCKTYFVPKKDKREEG